LAQHGIGLADHGGLFDRRMRPKQGLLHFNRRDVRAAANDDVFLARHELKVLALAAPHRLIASDALRTFLGAGEPASEEAAAPLSAGDIAARERKALVAVFCQK